MAISMDDSLKNSESNLTKLCGDEAADPDLKQRSCDSSSEDQSERERVVKQLGSTSSAFIGPACRPEAAAGSVRPDLEDALSEFYKELEKTDTPDGTQGGLEEDTGGPQPSRPLETNTSRETPGNGDAWQNGPGQKHPPWPHWYRNEPYQPRRPSPSMNVIPRNAAPVQNQWCRPPPCRRPPHPRFLHPPYGQPPPPSAFPMPVDSSPHMNHVWRSPGMTNHYNEELHFPPINRFPPPNGCSDVSQDFYGDAPQHLDGDGWGHDGGADVHPDWSAHASEGWSKQDCDWRRRFDAENELCEQEDHHKPYDEAYDYESSLVLILMRGLPGSGKTTLAKELLSTGPSGLILSTDDYFAHKNGYDYDPSLLGVAHEWNQSRAKEAMNNRHSPVIVDNTNIQAWEMKPYIKMALERGYSIHFHEPDTSWKFDPFELEKRNKHGVPQEKIAQMLDRFSFPISVDIVLRSQEPPHVQLRHQQQHRTRRKH
ncbi:NEDD4-binding protein 2-like 2 [Myripristis murdjan]|uniref:NEDD4 binding protein 2-like 2 n=1 Tax=Myripristis murdjan TaxID=586833 RepID=A0A667Y698_9TELE|nr:NEDD4-binding protein 2-like 2 [Myripristis murdjan]